MQQENYSDSDEEIEIEAIGIEVDSQPIELYKVLKIANAVSGGGEAKYAIAEGYVAVNGELETRKRCKIFDGDLIEFNGEYYIVICDQPVTEVPVVASKETNTPLPNKTREKSPSKVTDSRAKKRKPQQPKKASQSKQQTKGETRIEAGKNGGRSRIHFG